ncbi:MAG: transcriptional regulator GcvA [Gammaproteobacteria bacterium]|nr:transcriptional regulator GcvA [Gammaproteobacteria bacterium]
MAAHRRLPPLNPLKAFEAAARHLSFRLAAEELSVTPAAISQMVHTLEEYLDMPLFVRLNRSLRLTDAGQACLPYFSEGFDRIAEGIARLHSVERSGSLRIHSAPTFASRWLVPRLDRFSRKHPEIDIELTAAHDLPDFSGDSAEIAIDFGYGEYGDLYSELLFSVALVTLCSPKLLKGKHALKRPEDLKHYRLLHDEAPNQRADQPSWADWLQAAGATQVNPKRGPRFSHTNLALEAAMEGQGVALTLDKLAAPDIAAGRLVIPFDVRLPLSAGYYLVAPRSHMERPKVALFKNWILEETNKDQIPSDHAI